MSEVGEVASEVSKLSRDGHRNIGKISAAESAFVVENPGRDLRRDVEPVRLGGYGGVDLERAFAREADLNVSREW